MGKDSDFSDKETPRSSCQQSDFDNLHIFIQAAGLMTGAAAPESTAQVTTAHFRSPDETTLTPPSPWRTSSQVNCGSSDRRNVEDHISKAIFNSERRLGSDLPGAHSSTYLSSLNSQPGRIPGLYLPKEQSISLVVFGSLCTGRLDPQGDLEYVSLQLLETLQQKWPACVPATLLPLYLPCSPQGPAAVHLSKTADFSGTFVLGRSSYRRFQTMAMRAIDGELACAIQERLTSYPLDFLRQSLRFHEFEDIETLPSSVFVMPGQRLCYRPDANQLVAIARDSGIPTELVVVGATYDHGSSEYSHLATIAFRESAAKVDECMGSSRCKVKVLVISRDYEAIVQGMYENVPKNIARRTLSVDSFVCGHGLDHNYKLVVSLMAALEANPIKGNFSV